MGLDHDGGIGEQGGAHVTPGAPDLVRAERLVERYERRRPDVVRLAAAVSLAVRVEPGLLRRARRELTPGVSIGAELELWFSPITVSHTVRGLVLDPGVAAILRRRLRAGSSFDAAWVLVSQLHEHAPPTLKLEEEVLYAALTGPDGEAGALLEAALKTIAKERHRGHGIARWAERAVAEMPAGVRDSAPALELIATSRRLLERPVMVGVQLTRTGIRVSEPPASDAHVLELPPDPLCLDVRPAGTNERPTRLDVVLGQAVRHKLESGPAALELRAADGQVWQLRAREASSLRDGWGDSLQTRFLSSMRLYWRLMQRSSLMERTVNRQLINAAITKIPSPRSIAPSVESLTTGGPGWLVPPVADGRENQPPIEAVAELFQRDEMILCPKSTLLFAWLAQWFTEEFVRTARHGTGETDITRNAHGQQVNLSQLYGVTVEATHALRALVGGRLQSIVINGEEFAPWLCGDDGYPKPEFQWLPLPARPEQRRTLFAMGSEAVSLHLGPTAINVLLLREHNRLARELGDAYPAWDDERLFRTARNVLTVLLVKLLVEEFINHLQPQHFRLRFAPASFYDARWRRSSWVAVDLNVAYRWHSLVPDSVRIGSEDLSLPETSRGGQPLVDRGLGEIIEDASQQRAGKVCLFNTAKLLTATAELPGLRSARAAGIASYNDYRERCGLRRLTEFREISSDPRVRFDLARLYAKVDDVELAVGLHAEDSVPNGVLPPLMSRVVVAHMLARLMSHPLLGPDVYNGETFSPVGMQIIAATSSLSQLVRRNVPPGSSRYIGLTRPDWRRT